MQSFNEIFTRMPRAALDLVWFYAGLALIGASPLLAAAKLGVFFLIRIFLVCITASLLLVQVLMHLLHLIFVVYFLITGTAGYLSCHLWLSVLCMRSKAWLATRVSLRLARRRLPRTASRA